jgi:hypothetical protein
MNPRQSPTPPGSSQKKGINETLARRLTTRESQKAKVEADIEKAKQDRGPAIAIPDALPSLYSTTDARSSGK